MDDGAWWELMYIRIAKLQLMKNAFIYSLKAWLTTLLITPLIGFAIQKYNGRCIHCDYIEYYWAVIGEMMGYLLLLPIILITVNRIRKRNKTKKSDKSLIIIWGVSLTILYTSLIETSVYLYQGSRIELYPFEIIIAYSAIMAFALWFYNLKSTSNIHDL